MESTRRIAWVLLLGGLLSAVCALFGSAAPWSGVDIGATGASLFMAVLGIAIWMFATRGDAVFSDDMSVAERRAWVGMIFIGIVALSFGRHLWALSIREAVPMDPRGFFGHHFMRRLVALMIAWAVISYLIGRAAGGIEADERDRRLRHRADRVGDWAFTLIVIACITVLASVPARHLEWWLAPSVLANVLVGLLIVKSFVEHVALTFTYRFGR